MSKKISPLKMRPLPLLETLETKYTVTQCHVPEELLPQPLQGSCMCQVKSDFKTPQYTLPDTKYKWRKLLTYNLSDITLL